MVGLFAVTAGIGVDAHVKRFEDAHDDYSAILLKALADRLAEAFAERLHQRVRTELWGYAPDEALSNEQLIAEAYRGSGREEDATAAMRHAQALLDDAAGRVEVGLDDQEAHDPVLSRRPATRQSAKGSRTRMVSSRSGLVESSVTGHSISSSMVRTRPKAFAASGRRENSSTRAGFSFLPNSSRASKVSPS